MTYSHWVEAERPAEWLRRLDEQDGSYAVLLEESGTLALAAHRLARAKRRVFRGTDGLPTRRELHAAAQLIVTRVPHHPQTPAISLDVECDDLCISDFPRPRH